MHRLSPLLCSMQNSVIHLNEKKAGQRSRTLPGSWFFIILYYSHHTSDSELTFLAICSSETL